MKVNETNWQSIQRDLPDTARPVLEAFALTSLADINQAALFTGLSRDKAGRAVQRLAGGELVAAYPNKPPRPDRKGKPPLVYQLSRQGAELLRSLGVEQARAGNLNDDTAMLHRLAMTDIHMAAVKAGVEITTDRVLSFGDRDLRPDHQVKLGDGRVLLLEVEQGADTSNLRRVVESLQNKQDYFSSARNKDVIPEVRMILHLRRNKEWDRTLKTWEKALDVVRERSKDELSFELYAIPLKEFLDRPDWGQERHLAWREVRPYEKESTEIQKAEPKAVQALMERTSREDHLILRALLQDFQERMRSSLPQGRPDPEFFRIIQLIHSASHDKSLPELDRCGLPHASLYLLRRYLEMGRLNQRLAREMHRGERDTRWNITTILHRMQCIVNLFLGAHGFRTDGLLLVQSTANDQHTRSTRVFDIHVKVRSPQILMGPEDLVVPGQKEVDEVEEALSWVLYSLFAHSLDLGLGALAYW